MWAMKPDIIIFFECHSCLEQLLVVAVFRLEWGFKKTMAYPANSIFNWKIFFNPPYNTDTKIIISRFKLLYFAIIWLPYVITWFASPSKILFLCCILHSFWELNQATFLKITPGHEKRGPACIWLSLFSHVLIAYLCFFLSIRRSVIINDLYQRLSWPNMPEILFLNVKTYKKIRKHYRNSFLIIWMYVLQKTLVAQVFSSFFAFFFKKPYDIAKSKIGIQGKNFYCSILYNTN